MRTRLVLSLLWSLLLAGCLEGSKSPPANSARDAAILDSLREISDKLDRPAPSESVDLAPLERQIQELRRDLQSSRQGTGAANKSSDQPAKQSLAAGTGSKSKVAGWTGCLVHLDGVQGRCPPCEDFKADMERYLANPDHAWTFGRTNESHFRLQYHQQQDIALPTFEYFENGSLIHTIEGYPRTYQTPGYFGPLGKLIEAHPQADHKAQREAYKAGREKSLERWGTYGPSTAKSNLVVSQRVNCASPTWNPCARGVCQPSTGLE